MQRSPVFALIVLLGCGGGGAAAVAPSSSAAAGPASTAATPAPGNAPADAGLPVEAAVAEPAPVAVLDRAAWKAANERARACITKAKAKGEIRLRVVIDAEGRAVIVAKDSVGLADPVVQCVTDVFTQGHYTRGEGSAGMPSLDVWIRVPDPKPQEYQVD